VTISVRLDAATIGAAGPPSCLLGVTSGGSTALHVVASRGHAGLARRVCELAPSLVAARDGCLDTPLHRAAKAGHREVAACLLTAMRAGGADADAALWARNRLGATALYEAVRNGHAETVELLATEAPELAAITTDDGVSPLYLAAMTGSVEMARALLRPSPDGTPSPASSVGAEGRTALHAAAAKSKGMTTEPNSSAYRRLYGLWFYCNPVTINSKS
jgi:ankyrin repeat protein